MRPGFDEWNLHKAAVVALRSRDPSTKCGAIIVRPDKTLCSEGYNGFPRGMEDRQEWYDDRAEKYDRVIHAEMNALLHAPESIVGYTMYGSVPICKECAKHIGAAGIARAVWRANESFSQRWDNRKAQVILRDSGVEIVIVE